MRTSTVAASTAVAAAFALCAGAAPASAGGSPWVPYEQPDILVPAARSTCAFDVQETVVEDDEYYRNTELYPDGTVKTQRWRGPLVMRYTNVSTGASVVRDLSATATVHYRPDGSMASMVSEHGAFGATMPAGSSPASGIYVLDGRGTTLSLGADGTRSFTLGRHGSAENICEAID
ncbi:MAG TPA: hypothetical protein VIB11_06825 [Pedococcus sp.]|jgi:hypothetical protein|uniref:hypothetical protein n=1 Tax=Pedococcus sp. TaxID=2860345 RepID=UPI002F9359D5